MVPVSVLVTVFPRQLKTDKWTNLGCVSYDCPLTGYHMSQCVNMCVCIRYAYVCTVNVHLNSQWGLNRFFLNNMQCRAALTHHSTVHCFCLIMLGLPSAKPWLFTHKVPYKAEQLTSDWPAHSGLASNLWLTHRSPFCDIIQPNGLVLTPQGNIEERLWLSAVKWWIRDG